MLSSLGSYLSFVAILLFMCILWEGMVRFRGLSGIAYLPASSEWVHGFPPQDHTYNHLVSVLK